MLRVSLLSFRIPPATVPVLRKCLPISGEFRCYRSLTFLHGSPAVRLSVHPCQAHPRYGHGFKSFRPDQVARLIVSSSPSGTDSQPWSDIGLDDGPVQGGLGDSKSVLRAEARESPSYINQFTQDTGDSGVITPAERGKGLERMPSHKLSKDCPKPSLAQQSVEPLRYGEFGDEHPPVIPALQDGDRAAGLLQDKLHVLATTVSATEGWDAYVALSQLQQELDAANGDHRTVSIIPFAHLHRLARLLAKTQPKKRVVFLHLLTVLTTIRNYGGQIHLHEWNALIDCAGKGSRRTRPEDFKNALGIYYDMLYDRPPGSHFSEDCYDDKLSSLLEDDLRGHPLPSPTVVQPDIYTFTIIIDIAVRTQDPALVQRAATLLQKANLPPNRITHLSLLRFFTAREELSGVRSTLAKMREQNLELGIDGLNACMWGYGRMKRVDVVMMIYRLLRHNVVPEKLDGDDDITSVREQLRVEEGIVVASDLQPDEVTFTQMIQIMSYYGNLYATLSVFHDMLSSPKTAHGPRPHFDANVEFEPTFYPPTIHVFRAIFLGYSRHAVKPRTYFRRQQTVDEDNPEWNLENLQAIFKKFLDLPWDTTVSESTVFWILKSFRVTSGNDLELLQFVWRQIERRFGCFKGGKNHRLTKWHRELFSKAKKPGRLGQQV